MRKRNLDGRAGYWWNATLQKQVKILAKRRQIRFLRRHILEDIAGAIDLYKQNKSLCTFIKS